MFYYVGKTYVLKNRKETNTVGRLEKFVANNEGFRGKPYLCEAKKTTIGFGRNLTDVGITEEEARLLLNNDLDKAINTLLYVFTEKEIWQWSESARISVIDMIFNLGSTRFRRFKKMIRAIKKQDFSLAAKECLDSSYAKQVPKRAKLNAERIERAGEK